MLEVEGKGVEMEGWVREQGSRPKVKDVDLIEANDPLSKQALELVGR